MNRPLAKAITIQVAKLELKYGDRLLFKLPNYVTPEQSREFGDQARALLPGVPILVLPQAIDVVIVPRPDDLP